MRVLKKIWLIRTGRGIHDDFFRCKCILFMASFQRAKRQLRHIASTLEEKAGIPQVKEKMKRIKEINTDEFWAENRILLFEEVRKELRGLMKFLADEKKSVVTKLADPVIEDKEGVSLDSAFDFEDYRKKVNRYVEEHKDSLAIYKLMHNNRLSEGDYRELERVLTEELGSNGCIFGVYQ